MDAKGVSRLYAGRVRGRDMTLLIGGALVAMAIAAAASSSFRLFWHFLWEHFTGLF